MNIYIVKDSQGFEVYRSSSRSRAKRWITSTRAAEKKRRVWERVCPLPKFSIETISL